MTGMSDVRCGCVYVSMDVSINFWLANDFPIFAYHLWAVADAHWCQQLGCGWRAELVDDIRVQFAQIDQLR